MSVELEILYEDAECLVVLKPAGLPTQSPAGFDSLERRVRAALAGRAASAAEEESPASGGIYLGLPHRLDRPVSGVLLLAKTRRAARKLSRQFERRRVRKIYWARVAGAVEPASGTWIDFMRKVPDEPRSEIVPESHPEAQRAVLHYQSLEFAGEISWLEIELETGRMHQIRLQAAARGHPVLGDTLYGSQLRFGRPSADERGRAIALHGRSISFYHPQTGEPVTIAALPPATWRD